MGDSLVGLHVQLDWEAFRPDLNVVRIKILNISTTSA